MYLKQLQERLAIIENRQHLRDLSDRLDAVVSGSSNNNNNDNNETTKDDDYYLDRGERLPRFGYSKKVRWKEIQ